MANLSPGVYTKIIDLSSYVSAVPSTIGLVCALTEKGEDNVLKFLGSRSELISEYGEPNIVTYGKNYGQGPYIAYNFLGESGSLFFTRCMPDDAAFSNLLINVNQDSGDATASINVKYVASTSANTINELITALESATPDFPLGVIIPIGRGSFYNNLAIRFTDHSNPMISGVYVMDLYEKQSDGSEAIIESFEVSFDPSAKDSTGDSIFIGNILDLYSSVLKFQMIRSNEEYTEGYEMVVRVFDNNVGAVSAVVTSGSAEIEDSKQDFSEWETATATYDYCVIATDSRGNKLYGWLGAANGDDDEKVAIFNGRLSGATQDWIGDTSTFDLTEEISYEIKRSYTSIAIAFTSATPVPLKKGSEGSLLTGAGKLDTTVATQILSQGYLGQLTSKVDGSSMVDDVMDVENIYFTMVFDCGYPTAVKTQLSSLVQTRRDAVALLDNGDNPSFNLAMTARIDNHTFNNYFCTLYESYNKVYDTFTGQDVWFSPIFHMSYLAPRNDNVGELWWAIAGFTRGAIDSISELRFSPRLGQRDQMYLKQINPIVKFNIGYTVWGQLTTQARPSALQDLNIVRLVLYIKRALEQYCRFFIFELNDAVTWNSVAGDVVEFLESIKKKRGLYSYGVDVGATAYEKKIKTFHVNVMLEPTRVVEKIELNLFIK